jgi:hypothetical protein
MSKWIEFVKQVKPSFRKTDIYLVMTKDGNSLLGQVAWYAAWRCYAFYPNANCVFEKTCLQDITDFIKNLMEQRKQKKS